MTLRLARHTKRAESGVGVLPVEGVMPSQLTAVVQAWAPSGERRPTLSRFRLSDTRRAYRTRVQGELGHGGLELREGRCLPVQRNEHRTRLIGVDVHERQPGAINVRAEHPSHGVGTCVVGGARPAIAARQFFLSHRVAQLRQVEVAKGGDDVEG